MKLSKLILISAAILMTMTLNAQINDTVDVYYECELLPTGELNGVDTVFNVILVMDSTDVQHYTHISFVSPRQSSNLSLSAQERVSDPKIEKKQSRYQMHMGQWSDLREVRTIAQRPDGTWVQLKYRPRAIATDYNVLTLGKSRADLDTYQGEGINEEETKF